MSEDNLSFYLGDDDEGHAILLAARAAVPLRPKKPGQVAPQPVISGASVRRGSRSGNPNADPASGTFAKKGGGNSKQIQVISGQEHATQLTDAAKIYIRQQIQAVGANQIKIIKSGTDASIELFRDGAVVATFTVATNDSNDATKREQEQAAGANLSPPRVPPGVDEQTYLRRLDAVKEMARQVTDVNTKAAQQFLKDRVPNPDQVDIDNFIRDAREHQLDDLTDIFDQQLHGKVEQVKRSTKFVRLSAPSSWVKNVFAGLNDDEVVKIAQRLAGRGWDNEEITKNVIGKVKDEGRRTKLEQLFGEQAKPKGKKQKKEENG